MSQLSGKVAVVTGASKGIGAAVAKRLAEHGAAVVVNYATDAHGAEAVVEGIVAKGGKAIAVQADVSKAEDARRLIEAATAEFGHIDILVNNAGVYEFRPLAEIDETHFDRMFDINVKGLLFTTQAAEKAFNGRGGTVINVGSMSSQLPFASTSVYSATKAAGDTITRVLAAELGPKNIRVNSLLPGPVETEGVKRLGEKEWDQVRGTFLPRTPLGRVAQPDDIASIAVFLASDDSGWITGQIIPAAGGLN